MEELSPLEQETRRLLREERIRNQELNELVRQMHEEEETKFREFFGQQQSSEPLSQGYGSASSGESEVS